MYELKASGGIRESINKAFSKDGFSIPGQKGSHIHLRHPTKRPLTVPNHNEISRGTLRAVLREAGLSTDEFLELL